jgi:hypothetical protein
VFALFEFLGGGFSSLDFVIWFSSSSLSLTSFAQANQESS